jgi:hypothetical protein
MIIGLNRVRIVGDHPHRGEAGTIDLGSIISVGGKDMAKVTLDQGNIAEACYVCASDVRLLPKDEDPL